MADLICSPKIRKYFDSITKEVNNLYEVARKARLKGYDPEPEPEVFLAENVAERVVGLIATAAPQIRNKGVAERITELENEYGVGDWRIALRIAEEVASEKFCKFKDLTEQISIGSKLGLAYVTNGVVSSPLEGMASFQLKKRKDGKDYLAVYYAGPIRSAGGTAAAVSVLIADYVRRKLGVSDYDITDDEVKRYQVEIDDYVSKIAHRQYVPTPEEIELLVRGIKIEISGDPTEKYEVSRFKRLDRVETSMIRGGMCLVLTEGPSLKCFKLWKQLQNWKDDFGLDDWVWLKDFIKLRERMHSSEQENKKDDKEKEEIKIKTNDSYLKDIVAGRPVFGYPMASGAFRLRYGRTRISGYGSMCLQPATMRVLKNYLATGSQLKLERPGKATALSVCDSIDGPVVKLEDGSVVRINSEEDFDKLDQGIDEILYLGDILISYGEFAENGERLPPAGYCEEWWKLELEKHTKDVPDKVDFKKAVELSKKYKIPLHPDFIYFWKEISKEQFSLLFGWLKKADFKNKEAILSIDFDAKRALELIACPHSVRDDIIIIDQVNTLALFYQLGLIDIDYKKLDANFTYSESSLDIVNKLSPIEIRDKSGTFIGSRMGRPEKAKLRKLAGSPHGFFPVGKQGGRLRCFQSALEEGYIKAEFPIFFCDNCNKETVFSVCETCDFKTEQLKICSVCKKKTREDECHAKETVPYQTKKIDIKHYLSAVRSKIKLEHVPSLIKGVRGTWNKDHTLEHLSKALLRAKHKLFVNKDGTVRYDMTEMGITHFTPEEVGTSIKKLKELGYDKDINGKDIVKEDQIIELKPQDMVLPACPESEEEGAEEILYRIANFVDDLLVNLYGCEPYYDLKSKEDLRGQLVVGLAPHTSAGIVGRIVGFSKTQGCFAQPYMHDAMRRDLDGDETAVMLALDLFLNFSKRFLPSSRGATQDAPLVLTVLLNPGEIDDEVYDVDIVFKYPLELYEAALEAKFPHEIKIEQIKHRLGKPEQYEGFGFTHSVSNMNIGPRLSAYKTIPAMLDKVEGQIELARKIRASDLEKVATLVIERHFLRDIKGNLRKFTMQGFRCVRCNAKYRRQPLCGECTVCGGNIVFTIAEGTVIKYLDVSLKLAKYGNVNSYLKQCLSLLENRIESVFGKDKTKQIELESFFN